MTEYHRRAVDDELDELLPSLPAISLDGAKGVGKTATALQHGRTLFAFDDPATVELISASTQAIETAVKPVVLDEWQRLPELWDRVRRQVDRDPTAASYLLTGSAAPVGTAMHSGAGRIVRLRMRPLSLAERGLEDATISLSGLFAGNARVDGESALTLEDYVDEILASGFPGIRDLPERARRAQLDGYLANVVEREFAEQGVRVRRPGTLSAWMAAYAAATATTASYSAILQAATPGQAEKPARSTAIVYRDVLAQLWLLDPVPAWTPGGSRFNRLASTPKHFLVDPALSARLLQLGRPDLLGEVRLDTGAHATPLLGRFFEALAALSLQTYAQAVDAQLSHLRTRNGDHEVDFVIHRGDRSAIGVEVKLSRSVRDVDVRHLHWLKSQLGSALVDQVVITAGSRAYRRDDGVAVIPASLLRW